MSNFFTLGDDPTQATTEDRILFRSANEFSLFITNTAFQKQQSLTTTILEYCDDRDIDPENIAKLISKNLKERLALEMEEAGLMPRSSTGAFEEE